MRGRIVTGLAMLTLPFRPQAVIFDMDGLLFDTEALYRDAMQAAASSLGVTMPMPLYLRMIGLHGPRARELAQRELGPGVDVDALWAAAGERFTRMIDSELALKAGVMELLDTLDALRLPRAIATSSSHAAVTHHVGMHGLAARFDAVVAAGDYAEGKPAPDPYLLAASRLGVPADRCLALEDSHNGVRSALAAGMITVMVPDLLEATREIHDGPALIATTLHDVERALREG
jgi:HAD superfamily hydrolase (TIGR01509 family)